MEVDVASPPNDLRVLGIGASERGTVVEDEVRDTAGTPYCLRILPYRVNRHAEPASIEGVVLTLTDMTALDRARAKVEQLSTIVESSDDAIFAMSVDGTISTWNRGAERVFGYTADEAIGKNASMLLDDRRSLAALLRELESGQPIEHVSALRVRKDRTRLDVLTTLSPIRNQGIAADHRHADERLETQRALEDQQEKVHQLLQQAEDAARMRERFLAMLSHELRNPLAAVINAVTALREAPTARIAEHSRGVLERQARQMKRLLDDIRDVSRITSEKFVVDLRDAIDTAIETTAPVFAERQIVLERETVGAAIRVDGDGGRLCQVFANLLSNAAAHSPPHGRVSIGVTVDAERVTVRIRDAGDGIDPSLQPRIFDLFVHGDQQLDRPRGGLGVGLSLAKIIVDLHAGSIAVHSEGIGKGSEFTVTLPLGAASGSRSVARQRNARPRRIVLVDDQEDSRSMLKVLFEARKHEVYDAADGPQGIALIEAHRPDVAAIDIGLPEMNGFEVAQQIRKRRDLDSVVLVALTGYGGHADIEAASAAGFDEHVTKPAELHRLEQILERRASLAERA